jgi:hypothetical protein
VAASVVPAAVRRGHAVVVRGQGRPDDDRLDAVRALCDRESGLAVVVTYRHDGDAHTSVVNAGLVEHPVTGGAVVGFVVHGRGRAKLANLRRRNRATVVFRSGWEWMAVEGDVDLLGPDDQQCLPWPESAAAFRSIYVAAIGGSVDDWVVLDAAIERDGHAAALVRPRRVYGNAHPDA